MTKKVFSRVLPILLAFCVFMSTTAFAATTYYIDVTLSGPDANGVTQTVTGSSSKYGTVTSNLVAEVVQVLNAKLDSIESLFAATGLSQIVYDGMSAFADGEVAWDAYADSYDGDVTGDFKAKLRSLDSTFADLVVGVKNEISYETEDGAVYVVTVTLRKYTTGGGGSPYQGSVSTDKTPEEDEKPVEDGTPVSVEIPDEIKDCLGDETCPSGHLTDLKEDAWYHHGIHYCVENGLMEGYPNNLFGPNDKLTRAQVAHILYNLESNPAIDEEHPFDDVHDSHWFADAIAWASDAGIILGYDENRFGPNDPITREQLAAMLYRYSEYKGHDVSEGEAVDSLMFADADDVSDWALNKVKWAHAVGIIEGLSDGTLDPDGHTTRAQAATMFMRYCLHIAD